MRTYVNKTKRKKKCKQLLTRWFSPSSLSPFTPRAVTHSSGCGSLTIPVDPYSTLQAAANGSSSRCCCGPGCGCHHLEVIVLLKTGKYKLVERK
jgi:hypothetical protein